MFLNSAFCQGKDISVKYDIVSKYIFGLLPCLAQSSLSPWNSLSDKNINEATFGSTWGWELVAWEPAMGLGH